MKFVFTLGDWSGDGHSMYKDYTISCSFEKIEDVRELVFKTNEYFDLDLGKLFSKYGEDTIEIDVYNKLKSRGLNVDDFLVKSEYLSDNKEEQFNLAIDIYVKEVI